MFAPIEIIKFMKNMHKIEKTKIIVIKEQSITRI